MAAFARGWRSWQTGSSPPYILRDSTAWRHLAGDAKTAAAADELYAGRNRKIMSTLLQEIEAQISAVKPSVAKQNVGTVREIGDGVAKIEGLTRAKLNEMLDFGNGVTGLALNLEQTEVGAIILGDYTKVNEGYEVRSTGKLLQVPVGKGLLGRVVNMLGEPLDGKGPIHSDVAYPVEKIAPGIIRRRPVSQAVQTGITSIDAMIPIGRGQ